MEKQLHHHHRMQLMGGGISFQIILHLDLSCALKHNSDISKARQRSSELVKDGLRSSNQLTAAQSSMVSNSIPNSIL